jgi:hypothetical protein
MVHSLAGRVCADPARTEVMACLGLAVKAGFAQWAALGNGDIELTLPSGEIFHLGPTSVIRVG